jgi:hypothetical protein
MTKDFWVIREAYRKGYRIEEDGSVVSHLGRKLSLSGSNEYLAFSVRLRDVPHERAKRFSIKVHMFAKYQWFGAEAFSAGVEIRHLNGDSENNGRANLALGDRSANMLDIPAASRVEKAKKAASVKRRLSQKQAEALRRDRKNGMKFSRLMDKYGVCKSTVSYIVNNKMYISA